MADKHGDIRHAATELRKARLLYLVEGGLSILEALQDKEVGVSYSAYRKWRERDRRWAAKVDVLRAELHGTVSPIELTSAQFALRYFKRIRAPFQQQWIDAVENLRPGNILMALWPPAHGKTTTFEDYATEKVCRVPQWRNTTASESDAISKRIVGRVRNRLEVDGPFQRLVHDWGPFRPGLGSGQMATRLPWNNTHFNVVKKQSNDERDHSMLAIGWNSTTVSIRTDHLHIDDIQSLKTIGRTEKQMDWFRQDALSRPGEEGITSIAGTRVDHGDFYEELLEDEELEGILEVIRFPAIITNEQGEQEPLWPAQFSLEGLDRIRRKAGNEAFDRNYMMSPGQSKLKRTFSDEGKMLALDRSLKFKDFSPSTTRRDVILSLDPGLDPGKCTLDAWLPSGVSMRLVAGWESDKLVRNEEIVGMIDMAINLLARGNYRVSMLVVEAMNFQRGLARDDRLVALKQRYGFRMREHLTNINKYDENIGVASMAGDWETGRIILPYFDEATTRGPIDELCRQLKAWRPLERGSRLRQDRVMTMWFAWIVWQEMRGRLDRKPAQWKRSGLPYGAGLAQPIIPIGAKL